MRKILWLMVLSLVITACGTAATTTTPTTPVEQPTQKEAVAPTAEAPKYDGTLRLSLTADITNFDDVVTRGFTQGTTFLQTNESLWRGDWAKGLRLR